MNKLKIAYVVPRFHPFRGGGEQNTYALASRMAKEGHDVTVITARVKYRNEELAYREEYEGIHIVRNWAINEWLYAGFYPGLLFYLLTNRFDVIHSSGIGFLWREFCLIIKKIVSPKTKFITTPHGPFMAAIEDEASFIRKFSKTYYTKILKLFLNRLYDIFIKVTNNQDEWMVNEYGVDPKKIILIPNGIDKSYLEKKLHEHTPEDKVIITYLNRHEWYKGIQDVILAISKIRNSKFDSSTGPNFEFWIMGRAGNYTQKLTEMIEELKLEDYVKFIFSPTDEERDRIYYEESQIHILPSRWEGTGIVLIEAMAKGNVIITTYQNQAWDMLIKEGESGYVFNFGDEDTLTKILKNLLSDYELRQKIRAHNLEFAKDFTWEAVFKDYESIITSFQPQVG
jgi:glycosyltransferase involved in cell wall biosynthesis